MISQREFYESCESAVEEVDMMVPRSRVGNNPLLCLYGDHRIPGKDYDLMYPQARYHPDERSVDTYLDVGGLVKFSSRGYDVSLCGCSGLQAELVDRDGKLIAVWNNHEADIRQMFKPFATRDNPVSYDEVRFQIPDDWVYRCRIPEGSSDSFVMSLSLYFCYDLEICDRSSSQKQIFTVPITVRSTDAVPPGCEYYRSKNGTTVYIPPIEVQYR